MPQRENIIATIALELANDPAKKEQVLALWQNPNINPTSTNDNQNNLPNIKDVPKNSDIAMLQSYHGLPNFYGYDNYIIQNKNTCGQAVIGSFVDFYNKNPFGLDKNVPGHDGKMHFDNMAFIGKIHHEFGPNFPLPNGVTVRETLVAACYHYGLKYHEYFPAACSNGTDSQAELTNWISTYQKPIAVLVDNGKPIFGNPQPYTLHWCIVYGYDEVGVYIATWEKTFHVNWASFMDAWHCWWLPYPNNYYQLRVWDN